MLHPLHKTWDVLSRTRNAVAIDMLVAGLRIPDEQIRTASLATLLKRRSTRGNIEIIRGLGELTADMRELLQKNTEAMGQAIRQCLLHGTPELRENALEMVCWFQDFGHLPTLLNLLEYRDSPHRDLVAEVINELVNRLYEHLHFGKGSHASVSEAHAATFLRDAQKIRHQVLASLESACHRYEAHRCPAVVHGMLVLGDPENLMVKKLFQENSPLCRETVEEQLLASTHPGAMTLVVDSMTQNYPHVSALKAFERREDPEFICHLLRNWPRKLSQFQQKNFRDIKRVAWLQPDRLNLEMLPPGLHKPLVAFVLTTGIPQEDKLNVLEWMLKHGSCEGRLAATDVLVDLEDNKVQEVIIEGLESVEPDIQAWATSQLRTRDIPRAFELLIQRLDSPMEEVREAARGELDDFNILRVLEMYEHLDAKTCLAVGRLVQKIDPHAIGKLKQEMGQVIRRKRIRAARAALAMGVQDKVLDALLSMLQDSDALVRRTAVEVLGNMASVAAAEALNEALNDTSPRVREAASKALAQMRETYRRLESDRDAHAVSDAGAEPVPSHPALHGLQTGFENRI